MGRSYQILILEKWVVEDVGLIQVAQRLSLVVDCCAQGNEPAVPVKGPEFLDQLSLCQYPKATEQHVNVVATCCLNQ